MAPPTLADSPAPVAPLAIVAPAREVRGALTFGLNLAAGASSWRGDALAYSGVTIGLQIRGIVTPFVGGALGYARVDQRLLTRITVGVDVGYTFAGRYRPRVFGAFVHQHEESMASVAEQPWGAVLGIGDGIRHRAGAQFGAAFDWTFYTRESVQLRVGPELSAMVLGYSSGPEWFVYGGATLSGQVRLW